MTIEDYRSHSGLNFSSAKWLLQSAAHFRNPPGVSDEDRPALRAGTILDDYITRGIETEYVIKPAGMSFATKEGKAWRAAQTLPIMDESEVEDQQGMRDAIRDSELAQSILAACPERQKVVLANYKGVEIKSLLDMAGRDVHGKRVICDLKSTLDASPEGFFSSAWKFRYPMQMAWYSNALALEESLEERPLWIWLCVENRRPYNVAVYTPQPEHWDLGQRQMDYCVELYKQCTASGKWPGYAETIQPLPWKPWADQDLTLPIEETHENQDAE